MPATLLLVLAGCASPDPKLYTLVATAPASAPAALPSPPPVIELRHVQIPGYADRPEIVRSAADYRVHLASNERWSEPLGDMLQRVLTQDLDRRLPGALVYSDDGPISAPATHIVEVDLDRIDSNGAGQVVLDAQIAARGPETTDPQATRRVHITAPVQGPDTAAYAAALSDAVGQLADEVVALP